MFFAIFPSYSYFLEANVFDFFRAPERNSVVPTLTMSDGSSIDFSVKSGNMEILEYYVKRMVKNQNNSSESDHLDKVVTPPSLALGRAGARSSTISSCKCLQVKMYVVIISCDV